MKRLCTSTLPGMAIAVLGLLFIFQTGCQRTREMESITIAVSRQPISAPLYIGYDRKFFEREGLQVTLQHHWTGKDSLDAVMNKKADFSTVAETPIMFAWLKNKPVLIIATVADSDRYMKIVARKDRDIAAPRDLIGKNIGVSAGTNAEYFLDAYLSFNGILKDEIHLVPMEPENMADALAIGKIDAAVSWEPHTAKQREKLANNAVVLENEIIYQISWNIAAGREYVNAHPETVNRLLRALIKAQNYIANHPEDARSITGSYLGDTAFSLTDFNFDLRLGQSLVLDLEEQALWAIKNGLTGKKEVPNFLNLLYVKGMETVAHDSVTVTHK